MHKLTQLTKEYPGTLVTFLLYILMWSFIAMQLFDMHQHPSSYSHSQMASYISFFGFLLALIYLICLIIATLLSKQNKRFYSTLTVLASIPILVVISIVIIEIK